MLSLLVSKVRDALTGTRGATAVEYALMVGFIALAIIAGVALFGQAVGRLFELPPGLF